MIFVLVEQILAFQRSPKAKPHKEGKGGASTGGNVCEDRGMRLALDTIIWHLTHGIGIVNMLYRTIVLVIIGTKVILFVAIEGFILLRLFLLINTMRKVLMNKKNLGSNLVTDKLNPPSFCLCPFSPSSCPLISCPSSPTAKQRYTFSKRVTVRSKLWGPLTMSP